MKFEELIQRGTHADRPAAADVPIGTLYYETDTDALYRSSGSAWQQYAPSGGSPAARDCCIVRKSTDTTMSNGASVAISWDTEDYVTAGMHSNSTNPDRVTIVTAGRYLCIANLEFDSAGSADYFPAIELNGSTNIAIFSRGCSTLATAFNPSLCRIIDLAVNDYLRVNTFTQISTSGKIKANGLVSPVFQVQLLL